MGQNGSQICFQNKLQQPFWSTKNAQKLKIPNFSHKCLFKWCKVQHNAAHGTKHFFFQPHRDLTAKVTSTSGRDERIGETRNSQSWSPSSSQASKHVFCNNCQLRTRNRNIMTLENFELETCLFFSQGPKITFPHCLLLILPIRKFHVTQKDVKRFEMTQRTCPWPNPGTTHAARNEDVLFTLTFFFLVKSDAKKLFAWKRLVLQICSAFIPFTNT